jgi:hypothetical protein
MTMETSKGMQCYQNGPKPTSRDWQMAILEASQTTRWDI